MKNRTKMAIINSIVAAAAQILTILIQFVARTFFIKILGEQYLGLNGLFVNVLGVLNLAEMGIGSAITFSLYGPLAAGDKSQIAAIMNYLKKWYRYIAVAVILVGLLVTPFVPSLIADNHHFSNAQIMMYFVIALSGTISTYLLSYKRTLLIADQKGYVNSLNTLYFNLATQILQIVMLILTHSFLLYLTIQVVMNLMSNYMIAKKVDGAYEYLNDKTSRISSEVLYFFKKNMQGMISAKLGGVVVNGTDNLILSAFLGLSSVAKYANYALIMTGLTAVLTQAISAVSSSIGNLAANNESKTKEMAVFNNYFAITGVLSLGVAIGFAVFSPQFITMWVGEKYVLSKLTVFLIVFNFFVQALRQALIGYANSYGLYWQQRFKPIFEATVNLVVSIILVTLFKMGISGVVLGTITSNILVNFWWEPLVVFRYGLQQKMNRFLVLYATVLVVGGTLIIGSVFIGYKISGFWVAVSTTIGFTIFGVLILIMMFRLFSINVFKIFRR
ncbi:lipopolysaccharide biosynthesis protein [Weissella confusa]|uniref:Transporter n=1 Tax=Weissella confusa TaxID=1583 RepID=A0AAJ2YWB5_WEICO|nr:transporter [Weissella confusa]NBA11170.1 transporter [Weissella confusa]